MKTLIQQYKPFLLFLGKFFLSYIVLTFLYRGYLSHFNNNIDCFTSNVTFLTDKLLKLFNFDVYFVKDVSNSQVKVYLNQVYNSRIIEGCNAISVIILFISFIVAFSGRFLATTIYILIGSVLIYLLNVVRIAILTILFAKFPQYEHFLHGVLFPAIIYGIVFLLWIYWVKNYSHYASKSV